MAAETAPKSTTFRTIANRYLLLYNVVMTSGWILVLLRLIQASVRKQSVYNNIQLPLKLFQTGAVLEVLHALTKIVRSSPFITAFQVASRLMLVWGVVEPFPSVRSNTSLITMVLAWSLTEIPRYFYFSIAAITSDVPFWITLTRYTTFIPLYPLGASSEWLTLFSALPNIRSDRPFSISLPNPYNFSFDYYYYCLLILFLYIPGLPVMYSHMLQQRRKYVSRHKEKVKSQ